MSGEDKVSFVLVKDSNGQKFLCPIDGNNDPNVIRPEDLDDCIEEDVIGRYAGNINIKPSQLKGIER